MTHQPEQLNLWDRFFNRTRKEVATRGVDNWSHYQFGMKVPGGDYQRSWVEYRIDRLTGSVTLSREYLD